MPDIGVASPSRAQYQIVCPASLEYVAWLAKSYGGI